LFNKPLPLDEAEAIKGDAVTGLLMLGAQKYALNWLTGSLSPILKNMCVKMGKISINNLLYEISNA